MTDDPLLTRKIVLEHQDVITRLASKRRDTLVSMLHGDYPEAVARWALVGLPQDRKTLAVSMVDAALRQD